MLRLIGVCKGGKGFSNLESAGILVLFLSLSGARTFLTSSKGVLPFVLIVR